MSIDAEFVDWADVTGDSSEGAIVRLSDGDEHLLSVVVRVSRTMMKTEGWSPADIRERLPDKAVELVAGKAELDPAWVDENRGKTDLPWILSDPFVLKREGES